MHIFSNTERINKIHGFVNLAISPIMRIIKFLKREMVCFFDSTNKGKRINL